MWGRGAFCTPLRSGAKERDQDGECALSGDACCVKLGKTDQWPESPGLHASASFEHTASAQFTTVRLVTVPK